jgi:ankyrin repeat protein
MPAGADGKVDLLAVAAAISPPQLVKQLLERGARVQETLALHAAAIASAERIDEDEWKPDPSRVEVLHMLLDAGANVNQMQPDPKGPDAWSRSQRQRTPSTGTPLHYAVTEGSPEAVSCLLARGADLSAPSWSGHTAMQAAERARRQDILHVIALHKKQWAT